MRATELHPGYKSLLDTNAPEQPAGAQFAFEGTYKAAGRSFVLLTAGEVK